MYCSNCGRENKDTDQFCAFCGTKLKEDIVPQEEKVPKKKSKKWLYVILIIIALLFISFGSVVMLQMSKIEKNEKQYETYLEEGEKYLLAMDYEKAETAYLKAINIEPKKPIAYVELADLYVTQEKYEDAKDILEQAKDCVEQDVENWSDDEKEAYDRIDGMLEEIEVQEKISWVVEPTIEADDIYYIANRDYYSYSINQLGRQLISKYAVINQNGKYGLIQMDGTTKGDIEYKKISDFCGSYLMETITPKYSSLFQCDWSSYIINENGKDEIEEVEGFGDGGPTKGECYWYNEKVHNTYEDSKYLAEYAEIPNGTFAIKKSLKLLNQDDSITNLNGNYGICNSQRLVSDFLYEQVGGMSDGLLSVCRDGKWGYVNENGEVVISIEYDASWKQYVSAHNYENKMEEYCYASSEGYVPLVKDGVWEMRNSKGELVIPAGMFEAIRPVYQGKCWVKKDGKWGVIAIDHKKDEEKENTEISNAEKSLSEDELKANLKFTTSLPITVFRYDDYDGDGKKEAFAVTSEEKMREFDGQGDMDIVKATIWFIDHRGEVQKLLEEFGFCPGEIYANGNPKTFLWEMSGGGSNSITYVWCVQDGKVHEPKVSGTRMSFSYSNKIKKYMAYHDYFSDEGHQYDELTYRYDEKTGEFIQE